VGHGYLRINVKPTTDNRQMTTDYGLWTTDHEKLVTGFSFLLLRQRQCRSSISNRQSPFVNRQSSMVRTSLSASFELIGVDTVLGEEFVKGRSADLDRFGCPADVPSVPL
jgi:hypothetical protein